MNVKQFIRVLVTVTAVLLTASYAVAQGNSGGHGNGGGNGGGGGGGGHGPSYQIVAFDPPAIPSDSSRVYAINEDAQAVGFAASGGQTYAVHLDTQSGTYTILSDNGMGGAVARGNNDNDQTVGRTNEGFAVFWETPASVPTSLGTLPGDDTSTASDINNEGVIVGHSYSSLNGVLAVAWHVDAGGVIHGPFELPPLPGHSKSTALAVNEVSDGVAIATGRSIGSAGEGVIRWAITINPGSLTIGVPEDLGTFGGIAAGTGINFAGDVCANTGGFPVFIPDGGTIEVLPTNDAYSNSANAINDSGAIVGWLFVQPRPNTIEYRATLWSNGNVVNLNSYLPKHSDWHLEFAEAITNGGVIGGSGIFDVAQRGFVLIPD